ncbi:SIS domain-containing protein [Ohessyouella blattaphilus]|uniref:SIS domain-containing protein n=1 Tax=Ohessyouella blattaphilus TaxID=2949333 RepID=A0ABT1EI70_9FIRM|nr:hypothetical protein [Ohessyouella blattaphilus]MCP1110403.1 hypothetical protein [Ohessyouella blattaphilus]MCR8563797.1 hypothetical protein [Ohessyouella blattaphilus]
MSQHNTMMEEIEEQEGLLKEIFANREELTADFVKVYRKRRFRKVIFVGNGSPYYAGYTLSFAAKKLLKAEAEAIPAGVFHNHGSFDASGNYEPSEILLVCPAESGHSRGQVDAARRAKTAGICVMSTTLNPTGVLARESNIVLPKLGQHEVAMAATKGQTMALFMIFLNFLEAGYQAGNITFAEYQEYLHGCEQLPINVGQTVVDTKAWFENNYERIMAANKFFLLGYGANYGTVQEAALKFFECHQKPTLALELEESLHGPFRALKPTDIVFFVMAEKGAERERMERLARAVKSYCANCVMVTSNIQPVSGDVLTIHSSDIPFVNAVEYLIPFQVLSFLIAKNMGIDLSIPLVSALDEIMLPAYED